MAVDLTKLNQQQLAAVKHKQGPALVIAGAGTGKTQVITTRIAYLIDKAIAKPSEIVALTFTDKAAGEMEVRVSDLLGKYTFDVNITTFNAFGHELLRRFGFDIGISSSVLLLNEAQKLVFLTQHYEALKLDYYAPVTRPEAMLPQLASYFSKLKDQLVWPESYLKYAQLQKNKAKTKPEKLEAKRQVELARAYQIYQQLCRVNNVIDFDDQVYLAVQLLQKRPNVLNRLKNEYKYWLVDEFQDTNLAQSALLDLLAASPQSGKSHIMVVGDDDQCIYRFRGAAISNILGFNKRYPSAKQIALIQNYRNSQQILDSAYQLIQNNNPDRLEARFDINKRLAGQFSAQPPKLKSFTSYEEEAAWVAGDIKSRLAKGEEPNEIAVLLRKNAQAKVLERYLAEAKVEFVVLGQSEDLYRQPEVKMLLHALKVIADPSANDELYHLLSGPAYNAEPAWLRKLSSQSNKQHVNLEELLSLEKDLPDTIAQMMINLQRWRELLPSLSAGQLSYRFLEDSGYLHSLISEAKDNPALDQKIRNLNLFFTSLLEFERVATDTSVIGYLNSLPALQVEGQNLPADEMDVFRNCVSLLTVHRAKGLEFETVYLFDMSQDVFPARRQATSLEVPAALDKSQAEVLGNAQLEEERRLMYVAMTRAKRNLLLSFSLDHGGKRAKKPSQFIEEAMGQQPVLDKLRSPIVRTAQIELFKAKQPASNLLPPTIYQGEEIVLSVAQVQDYLMCPAEFYLRHILQPPQPFSLALQYGTLLHAAILQHNRQKQAGKPLSLEQLQQYLSSSWPAEGFTSRAHRARGLKQALKTIAMFYRRESASKLIPAYVEKSFTLKLNNSTKLKLNGRFDAVYEADTSAGGEVEIRDYKTGASNITNQDQADRRAKESLQLGIYALAWQHLKGVNPSRLTLDFIDNGLIGTTAKSARQLETVERKLRQVADGVRAKDFAGGSSHIFCSHMEYGF